MSELSRLDFLMMRALDIHKCHEPEAGATLYEIGEFCEASVTSQTLYRRLERLRIDGLLDEGVPVGRAKSYYLTDKARGLIEKKEQSKDD